MPLTVINVTGVTLDKSTATVEKGNTLTLVATVSPEDADDKSVTWSSSDTSVATVDDSGVVTTVGAGSCTITVTTNDGGKTASCLLVSIVYPTAITLDQTELVHNVNGDDPETLSVIFTPSDCTEKGITWESTNTSIVIVDNGTLSYTGTLGDCYVTAEDIKGHTAQCHITTVYEQPRPKPPKMASNTEYSITLEPIEDGEYTIDEWDTSQYTTLFEGLEPNTTYQFRQRYYKTSEHETSKSSDVAFIKTKDIIHVESVELDKHTTVIDIKDKQSDTLQFEVTILPEQAAIKEVFWSIDRTDIGSIDDNGLLTVKNSGKLIVTVTSVDTGVTDECIVEIYKQWDTPNAPTIFDLRTDSVTFNGDIDDVFSIDNGETWQQSGVFTGLKPKTLYNVVRKKLASGYKTESKVSNPASFITPEKNPDPGKLVPTKEIILSAHKLYFNLQDNTYARLRYTMVPSNATYNLPSWSVNDKSIITVGAAGDVTAVGPGHGIVYVRTVDEKEDCCHCYVYNKIDPPSIPSANTITKTTVELDPVENCEYSMDCINWQESTLFEGLTKGTFYTFYQRYKAVSDYQPPSPPSSALTIKTKTDEKPGGTSPSGYTYGQKVEVNNISIYPSPYAKFSNMKKTGIYYIFNIIESNHRIRITDQEDSVNVCNRFVGWVNIADLKLIEDEIYVGDKVIVNGNINMYADGSGTFINKNKEEMYVTDIISDYEYGYGVTTKPGLIRQAFAKRDQLTKYRIIKNDEETDG